ncbi:MAG: sodium/solute symporter [Phycisphaerae bacterium]|jgi:SSS family solute:Na+ symporter
MHTVDWVVIGSYFAILLGIAWWVILKSKNTADDYFLAGRHLGWFVIGASIFASNIGSEHLVGLAGAGATSGVAMAHFELHAWCLLVLAWVFVPFYARTRVFTTPEFLERRFSPTNRWLLSLISLFAYILTKMAVGIYAGGIVFGTLLPDMKLTVAGVVLDSFWLGSFLVIIATGLYTILGGLRAVAYTEAVQTFIFVVGSALVTWFGLQKLGGWDELRRICGSEMFNLWKPLVPAGVEGTWAPVEVADAAGRVIRQAWYFNGNFPWVGMLFCAPIIGLWYWCTDQYIVQRCLGAPDETQARRGAVFAAVLKLLPVFIFIIPGMICYALASGGKSEVLRQALFVDGRLSEGRAQAAFPLLVQHVLPVGVRGMVVAGLLAALMSSLAGALNASSTLFTIDFYGKLRPRASQAELVWMGRIATLVMVVIALGWIPVVRGKEGLYYYLQSVQGYLAPPIFAVFFLGVFNKRLNSKGAMAALLVGFALGAFRLAVDTPIALKLESFRLTEAVVSGGANKGAVYGYPEGSFLWIINKIYFQYYSLAIFLVSAAAMIVVSHLTAPPDERKIEGLTYATITQEHRLASRRSWDGRDVAGTVFVLAVILAAYLYFNG